MNLSVISDDDNFPIAPPPLASWSIRWYTTDICPVPGQRPHYCFVLESKMDLLDYSQNLTALHFWLSYLCLLRFLTGRIFLMNDNLKFEIFCLTDIALRFFKPSLLSRQLTRMFIYIFLAYKIWVLVERESWGPDSDDVWALWRDWESGWSPHWSF